MNHYAFSLHRKTLLLLIGLLVLFDTAKANKEEIDKVLSAQLQIGGYNDTTSDNCGILFNKLSDLNQCLKHGQLLSHRNSTDKASKHYYVFVIVSKVEGKYYEYYFGTCLNFNETTVNKFVDEDYLMENSNNQILNSQITRIREIRIVKNLTPASITILLIVVGFVAFCFIAWYNPSRSSILEKNEYELTANNPSSLSTGTQYSNENQSRIHLLNDAEGIERELKKKHFIDELYNSFNIVKNFSELFAVTSPQIRSKEIRMLLGLRSISYFITMLYTCAPVLFKLPISNPNFLYDKVKLLILQFIFNGDMFFDIIFAIDGFIIAYTFINSKSPYTFTKILFEVIGKILESYVFMLVIFFIFWKVLPISGPLGIFFFESERESCQCQVLPILSLYANFTFGLTETFYPYCVYHYWFVHLSIQYFVLVLLMIKVYKYNRSFFHLVFFLVCLMIFFVQLWSTSISPSNQNFYDVLRKNPVNIQMQTQRKFITRMGSILIGVLVSILYNEKDCNFISKIQKSRWKCSLMFIIGFAMFSFWFLIHYLTINQYVLFSTIFNFFYKLFKREVLVVALFLMVIPLFSSSTPFSSMSKALDNCFVYFFSKIAFGFYLVGSIIARLTFYNQKPNEANSLEITNLSLFLSFTWIVLLSFLLSIAMTILFQSPFVKIGSVLKKKYINYTVNISNKELYNS